MMNRGNQSMGMRGAQMGSGLLGNAPQNFQGNFPNNMQGLNIGNMQGNLPMSGNMQGNMMGNLQSGLMGNIQNNMENPTNDMNINNMMNMNQRNQQHMGLLGHMPHNQQGNIMQNMSNMQQLQQAGNISGIGGMGNMGNNNLNQGMMTDEMRQAMMMKNMISMSQNTNQLSQNQQQQTSVMNTALGAGNNMLTNMAGNQGLLGSQMAAMQQHGGNIQQQLNAAELQLKAQQQQQVSSAIGSSADRTTATQTGGMMTAPLMSAQELNRNAGGRTLLPTPGNAQLQQQQLSFGNSTNFSNQGFLGKQDSNQGLLGGRQDSQGLLNRQNGQGLIVDSDNQRILGRLDNQGLIGRQDNQTLIGRQDNQTLIGRQDNQTLIGRQDSGLHDRFDDHRSQFDRRQNEDHMFDRGHRDENRRIISSWDSNDDRRNRLSQDFGRYSGNSQDIKQASPEKEAQQYDPEEPTEDDMLMHPNKGALDDFNNLRTGSPISGQKRSLSSQYDDFHQSKQRREMGGESTHDIQNGNAEKFHCQLCSVSCGSVQEFDQHMHSDLHQQRMASITSLYQARTEQQIQRMKAEEVLRRVEQAGECNICQKKIRESLQEHTQGQEHIRKERLTKRGCILCKTGRFENYPSYVAHIDSDAHKQAKEILNKELAEKKKQNDYSGDHSHQQNTQDQASSEESREKTPPSNGLQGKGVNRSCLVKLVQSLNINLQHDITVYEANNVNHILSNKAPCLGSNLIEVFGKLFVSSNLAFHYIKAKYNNCLDLATKILKASSNSEVESFSKKVVIGKDSGWQRKKIEFMADILTAKAKHCLKYREALCNSNALIVQVNEEEMYWSVGLNELKLKNSGIEQWPGQNIMGLLHMKVRASFLENSRDQPMENENSHNWEFFLDKQGSEKKKNGEHDNKVVPQEVDAEVIQGGLTYDPDTPIGQSFVIPVKGFFCRLCHKFYNNEDMAKNAHCKSLRHFEKYQEHVVSQQQESDAPKTNTKKTSFTPSAKSPDLTIKINNVQNDSDVQFQDNIDSKDTMEVDGSRALDGAGDAQRSMRRMRSEGRKHRN